MIFGLLARIISMVGSPVAYILASIYFIYDLAFFVVLLVALGISIAIILLFRNIFTKERPDLGTMKSRYRLSHSKFNLLKNYYHKLERRKFASGHVARITVFAVLVYFYLNYIELSVVLLVAAFVVGFSRIYLKRHTGIDVFFGFVVGVASGYVAWLLLPFIQQFF